MLDTAKKQQIDHALSVAFHALEEKKYNPIEQLTHFMLTEDPYVITTFQNARSLMEELDHQDICRFLLEEHFNK